MIYLCGSFPFKLHHFMVKVPHSHVTTKGSCSLASNFKLDEGSNTRTLSYPSPSVVQGLLKILGLEKGIL